MCVAKVHCCRMNIKDGAMAVVACDTVSAALFFLFTLLITIMVNMFIEEPSYRDSEVLAAVLIAWTITILFFTRAIFGMCSTCRGSAPRLHFFSHVGIDVLWMALYLLVASGYWLSPIDLAVVIVNSGMNGYFDWILYSVWRTDFSQPERPRVQWGRIPSHSHSHSYRPSASGAGPQPSRFALA